MGFIKIYQEDQLYQKYLVVKYSQSQVFKNILNINKVLLQ